MQQDNRSQNNGGSWLAIVIVILIVILIANAIGKKNKESQYKSMANDINYCRSVGAQYGMQGTQEFSRAYNACLDGKGW